MLYFESAKFGNYRHCGSRYEIILVCDVLSQDHVAIRSWYFMGRTHLRSVRILLGFVP